MTDKKERGSRRVRENAAVQSQAAGEIPEGVIEERMLKELSEKRLLEMPSEEFGKLVAERTRREEEKRQKARQEFLEAKQKRWEPVLGILSSKYYRSISVTPEAKAAVRSLLDALAPEHMRPGRSDNNCSDEHTTNGFYMGNGSMPRCVRCALLEILDGGSNLPDEVVLTVVAEEERLP